LAVVGEGEAALGERGAGYVSAEVFAQGAVVCGDVRSRVQGIALLV